MFGEVGASESSRLIFRGLVLIVFTRRVPVPIKSVGSYWGISHDSDLPYGGVVVDVVGAAQAFNISSSERHVEEKRGVDKS